jgi:uncharacterized membrane protein YcaP (DUF421 family)
MWFDSTSDLVRVVVAGGLAYAGLVVVLRLAGKRTLASLNAFDLVVTVALGSVLAASVLDGTVSLAEGWAATVVLVGAQYTVARLTAASPLAAATARSAPTAVVVRGRVDDDALRRERLLLADLRSAVRAAGVSRIADVDAVVLETNGSLTVVPEVAARPSAMEDVANWTCLDKEPGDGRIRSTTAVLERHLELRRAGELERDLAENYTADVVLLSAEGVHRGRAGVRHLATILRTYAPEGHYRYDEVLVDGEHGLLQWTADGRHLDIHDGADSYVVRAGRIVAQTIHYSTRPSGGRPPHDEEPTTS